VGVGKDLDLDVAAVVDQALQHQRAVSEGALGLAARTGNGLGNLAGLAHQAHAASATAGHGFDQQREAQLQGLGRQACVVLVLAQIARRAGHAGGDHAALGQGLVTHGFDGRRRRADEDQACVHAGLGKGRVFTQEAVAGVNGVGAGLAGGLQQGVDAQVGVRGGGSADPHGFVGQRDMGCRAVGVAEHRHGPVAEVSRRADDAAGDLAPVGDQDFFKHRVPLNTFGWQSVLLRVPRPLRGLLLDLRKTPCHPNSARRSSDRWMFSSRHPVRFALLQECAHAFHGFCPLGGA
jgi:hypothetical protein